MSHLSMDTLPTGTKTIFIVFQWGAGLAHIQRYVRGAEDTTISGNVYTAEPKLSAESSGPQTGGTKDVPWYVRMPAIDPIVSKLIRIYPWADTYVTIMEGDPLDTSGTNMRTLFWGKVGRTWMNKAGFKRLCQIEVLGIKALLQYGTGIPIDVKCPWAVGDNNCCATLGVQSGTITAISANVISVPGITTPPADPLYWNFGDATIDGLSIEVRSRSGTNFGLFALVPPEWMGATVTLTSGCDQFPETCEKRYNNLQRFAGAGIAIPAYHPQIELGAH